VNIIIAGAGKVGFNLAKTLSIGHNVIVIDKNKEALLRLQESLDILPFFGDIQNPDTYKEFLDVSIDLYIAVTNLDEANIISCIIIDDVLKPRRKFLRLKNHFYSDTSLSQRLGIEELIFPLTLSSKSILNFLEFPKINNIKDFKYTDFKLISIFSKDSFIYSELVSLLDKESEILVAIERDKNLYIDEKTDILEGDLLYFFIKKESIKKVCEIFDKDENKIQNCVVFGADDLGVGMAKILIKNKKNVKLIEKDVNLCHKADELLGGEVDIINSKYQDEKLFKEESLDRADLFISTYKDDEYNIIKCLEAKEFDIKKIVAVNNDGEFYHLMHRLGIVTVRGPKMSAYNTIIEAINNSKVIVEKYFCGGKGVLYLRKIFENSKLIGKTIKNPKYEDTRFFLIRNGSVFLLESEVLEESDVLVGVCSIEKSAKVKLWIYEL